MSSILSFGMPSSKKEKHYANSRARRHSGDVVISQSKKSKKEKEEKKDTDTESISSSTPSSTDTVVVPPPEPKKCPLRFMLAGMFETEAEGEPKKSGCPLRRVQLWHTIPLCLLAAVNLILVIIALLGLAGYRIATPVAAGLQGFIVQLRDNNNRVSTPVAKSLIDMDDASTIVEEKQ
jgi:hypothetical protein